MEENKKISLDINQLKLILNQAFTHLLEAKKSPDSQKNALFKSFYRIIDKMNHDLNDKQEIHVDDFAYFNLLIAELKKIKIDPVFSESEVNIKNLLERLSKILTDHRKIITNQYDDENKMHNAVVAATFIDTNDGKPYVILFNYQYNELTTLGVRVTKADDQSGDKKEDKPENKERVYQTAIIRRLIELGLIENEKDMLNFLPVDRDKYGLFENNKNYVTKHYIAVLSPISKEMMAEKINLSNSDSLYVNDLIKPSAEIFSLEELVNDLTLHRSENGEKGLDKKVKLSSKNSSEQDRDVRLSTALVSKLAAQNWEYIFNQSSDSNDTLQSLDDLTDQEILKLSELGSKSLDLYQVAFKFWLNFSQNKDPDVITLYQHLRPVFSKDNELEFMNPSVIAELCSRLFKPGVNPYFHEDLSHWFTKEDRLILQIAAALFNYHNSGSNNLNRKKIKECVEKLQREVIGALNKKKSDQKSLMAFFLENFETPDNYNFLTKQIQRWMIEKKGIADHLCDKEMQDDTPFLIFFNKNFEHYKKMVQDFDKEQWDNLDYLGRYFYCDFSFEKIATHILMARIMTEAFEDFVLEMAQAIVEQYFFSNDEVLASQIESEISGETKTEDLLLNKKLQKTLKKTEQTEKSVFVCGPVACGKSSLFEALKEFIQIDHPCVSAPDELIELLALNNPLLRAFAFLAESWFIKKIFFKHIENELKKGIYSSFLIETLNPEPLLSQVKLHSKKIQILWNFASPVDALNRMVKRGRKENRIVPSSNTIASYKQVYKNMLSSIGTIIKEKLNVDLSLYNSDLYHRLKNPNNSEEDQSFLEASKTISVKRGDEGKLIFNILNLPSFMLLLHYDYAIVDKYNGNNIWKEGCEHDFFLDKALASLDKLLSFQDSIQFQYQDKNISLEELKTKLAELVPSQAISIASLEEEMKSCVFKKREGSHECSFEISHNPSGLYYSALPKTHTVGVVIAKNI